MKKYTHAIILDFEATCDDKNQPRPQEIIEFPSVLISIDENKIVDQFRSYVRPVHNPKLTEFCKEFTNTKQSDVDNAPLFKDVLQQHTEWLAAHNLTDNNAIIVTCGDWDLGSMLPSQSSVSVPPVEELNSIYTKWCNVKKIFCTFKNVPKAPGMSGMLKSLGIELEGHHHCGIDDCKNISKILLYLLNCGATLELTAELPLNKYPPVSINLSFAGKTELGQLKNRSVHTLQKLAGKTFKSKISTIKFENGDEIIDDEQLRNLSTGTKFEVS